MRLDVCYWIIDELVSWSLMFQSSYFVWKNLIRLLCFYLDQAIFHIWSNTWYFLSLRSVVEQVANWKNSYSERSIIMGFFCECCWAKSWTDICFSPWNISRFTWWAKFGYFSFFFLNIIVSYLQTLRVWMLFTTMLGYVCFLFMSCFFNLI